MKQNLNKKTAGKITLIVGIGLLAWSGYTYTKASASQSWPSTQGQVVTSEVKKTTHTSQNGTKWVFKPILKYEYSVDNLDFTGNRIRFTSFEINHEKEHKAKREISAYPVGKKVSVFYNPNNPTDAVLVVGVGSRVYMGFGLGILLLAIGGIFVESEE